MGIHERKEREREQRREVILNAAQKVFFEKGLQSATMDEIAEEAELSKGTLYLYYKGKEDLYLAVMIRGIETLYDLFKEVIGKNDGIIMTIQKLSAVYIRFFREHGNLFRMFHYYQTPQFHKQVSEEILQLCNEANQRIWKMVVDLLRKGVDEGVLRSDLNPEENAVILWSSASAILMRMDTRREEFKQMLNVDLENVLRESNALLLESMMTESSRKQFQSALFDHQPS